MPFESPPPDHQRCKAKSKRRGERCLKYRERAGVCRFHGARSKRGHESGTYVHGGSTRFIDVDTELPEFIARIDELENPEKRRDRLAMLVALASLRSERIPLDVEYIEAALRLQHSELCGIKLLHEIDQAKPKSETPAPVFQFYSAGQVEERWWRFSARGVDGVVSIQMIDGVPYIYDEATGHFVPAKKEIEPEFQIVYYREDPDTPRAKSSACHLSAPIRANAPTKEK